MFPSATVFSVILIATILGSAVATKGWNLDQYSDANMAEFIKTSCKVTLYPQVCVSSLLSYAASLKATQSDLVKAAVQVCLVHAGNTSVWATAMKARGATMSKREKAALGDCVEDFGVARDEIRESLSELEKLQQNTFKLQMDNVKTWMSAALTNENSCLDGFQVVQGRVRAMVKNRVDYMCKLISNALALINRFAATG